MNRSIIATPDAPQAIGTYSQAVKVGQTTYLSGQIPLIPESMQLVEGDIEAEIRQAFANLRAVCEAAGGSLNQLVKLNVYLTDLSHFPVVNAVMDDLFDAPFPARAALGVAALPRNARVEVDGILVS
ncbi:MAG: Rid family detoxifying hydrolase [Litorivicinaceae bacterium]|jgi:reactive intermediate/imine deaminase|nr:Rid family detoxifying hydrolase [Litorivicinaceae bacterium]MDP5329052.1 Rid family detoxifying hydrolase [Litorivicinaceae bacterium]MDP5330828.1 Rid family detoxifying hydrolase [Litorivicinaceae bacterium]